MFDRSYADPYIIAEIGVNHEGSLARAKDMISAVARAGGHAAKFQTYTAGLLASEAHSPSYWDTSQEPTTSQYELFQRFDGFGADDYAALAAHCREEGIDFLSTPFDLAAVTTLAPLMPAMKIASADLTNVPLLRAVAAVGKPILMSVGASTHDEIRWALDLLERAGAGEIALLHCVLRYPTPPAQANLLGITELRERFGDRAVIGYSDHVAPTERGTTPALDMAATLGARVIEKHFTDDRTARGNDHYHAFDEAQLASFVRTLAEYRELAGDGKPDVSAQSSAIENARRRVFVSEDLSADTELTEAHLRALRANVGVEIASWDDVVGRSLRADKRAGDPIEWDDLR
ncbi:N-acetylneuraminate synthase family protein [Leucobacter luti]|uniref:N-acetylneuraminate synthase n=1 Tax=Leucobacter luti TaxID=340320 RepID=A0A4Q7TQ92_9MICO|nr:N-acetylneuraminate synthase family protein [Leucobacter luti]MBL3699744.1 acetylneuraminic acid synthetase [Leucobacter luti]RZT62934.1 N-acetylneuraminate synthase [Leucobacter luti]